MPRLDAFVRGSDLPPRGGSAFPTFASTGGTAGSRTNDATSTFSNGQTWANKAFTTDPIDLTGISNITFTNCSFVGGTTGDTGTNRTFTDCDFNGNQYGTGGAWHTKNGAYTGCRFWNAAQAFWDNGSNTFTDCFAGELYLTGSAHGEAAMIAGSGSTYQHCTLFGQYTAGGNNSTDGISAAVVMYTHGTWGSHSDVTMNNCLLMGPNSVYTIYWGTPAGAGSLTNCSLTNNQFRKAPGSTTSASSNGTDIVSDGGTITGNVYEGTSTPVQGQP